MLPRWRVHLRLARSVLVWIEVDRLVHRLNLLMLRSLWLLNFLAIELVCTEATYCRTLLKEGVRADRFLLLCRLQLQFAGSLRRLGYRWLADVSTDIAAVQFAIWHVTFTPGSDILCPQSYHWLIGRASSVLVGWVTKFHRLRDSSAGKGIEVLVRLIKWLAPRTFLLSDTVLAMKVRISVYMSWRDWLLFLVRLATLWKADWSVLNGWSLLLMATNQLRTIDFLRDGVVHSIVSIESR